jgi:hypothetical protein
MPPAPFSNCPRKIFSSAPYPRLFVDIQPQTVSPAVRATLRLTAPGSPAMTQFSLDLPFFMPLEEGTFLLRVADDDVQIQHSVVEREVFDPRIGGIAAGSFGFVRDQAGALRYSTLTTELDDGPLGEIGAVLTGRARSLLRADDVQGKAKIALAIFNRFLDKYRVTTRKLDVKPIGSWDLALLRFDDGRNSGEIRFYGGGITLPVVGLAPAYQQELADNLANPEPNAAYEIAAVDALRTVEDGQTLESIVIGIGALEAALDLYFGRTWRLSDPRVFPQEAAAQLRTNPRNARNVFTVEDVLGIAGVRAKVAAYAAAVGTSNGETADLYEAIDLRNLAVHSGVHVPQRQAKLHVERLVDFVLDQLKPRIRAECPTLPRAELLYAWEEALANDCSPDLQQLVDTYLTPHRLTAKLYNQRHKRNEMTSERFGDTLVLRISFQDFTPDQKNLFIAQALLHHYLERRGDIAHAQATDDRSEEDRRPFFEHVASAMTRTVWGAAINRRLCALGFEKFVQREAARRAAELSRKYRRSFVEPRFEDLGYWVDYLDIAQTAAELPLADRETLLMRIARVAPRTAQRSRDAIPPLERVEYDNPESIREALIQVHDAHDMILASASIFDPVTRQRYGRGLQPEDLGVIALRPSTSSGRA